MNRVRKGMVVSMRYVMKNERGDILEDTRDAVPTAYLHGTTSILPVLQTQLEGLLPGDEKKVTLGKEGTDATETFTFEVIIDAVKEAAPEELILGYPVNFPCGPDCICFIKK